MAAALFRERLPHLDISSAGIGALVGKPADPNASEVLKIRGVDVSAHRAQQITGILCRWADLILVMETAHKARIEHLYPFSRGKVFRLGQYDNCEVFDPFGHSFERFEECYSLIEPAVEKWVSRVAKLA